MRFLTAISLILLLALPLTAQKAPPTAQKAPPTEQKAPAPTPTKERESELLKELAKFEYKAKRSIPAADSIFVEKGKVQEALYKLAMQTGGVLLKPGATTKVSSVKIMDRGIQVFFETDKCALINLAADSEDIAKMSLSQMVDFSKASISALFQIIGGEKGAGTEPAPSTPTGGQKPSTPEEKKPN